MADASIIRLRPELLNRARFAPYGDVIDASPDKVSAMNDTASGSSLDQENAGIAVEAP